MKTYLTPLATLLAAMLLLGCGQPTDTSRTAMDTGNSVTPDAEPTTGDTEPAPYQVQRPTLDNEMNQETNQPGMAQTPEDVSPAEQPAQEQPGQEQPTQEQPAQEQPAQEQPVQEQPSQEPTEEVKPAEPVDVIPSEEEKEALDEEVQAEQEEMIEANVNKAEELKVSLQQMEQELKEAQETLVSFTRRQESEDFKRDMRDKLDSFDSKIEPVQEQATDLKKQADQQQQLLLQIKQQRKVLLEKLKALDPANPEEAEKMQEEINQEWEKLQELSRQIEGNEAANPGES